jgi:DEAD/DEAH box helicase domain-containing protein
MQTINELIHHWKNHAKADPISSYYTLVKAYEGEYNNFPDQLLPELADLLIRNGISSLYTHQVETWLYMTNHESVVITTPTASGKTLAYLLPILQSMLINPDCTALLIFPTKALAQDQMKVIQSFLTQLNEAKDDKAMLSVGIYDGDTPQHLRKAIRQKTNILLTNPDMLHLGILPNHTAWNRFLEQLTFIVVDEIHTYRGVFGSHVANIFRRLMRICHFYQANPTFVGTSATIANPQDFSSRLFGESTQIVKTNSAPRGDKHYLLLNPPVQNVELNLRESASAFSMRILPDLVRLHKQTLVFVKSRRAVELLTRKLRDRGQISPTDIASYRSGYKPLERREIEQALKTGVAKIVFSTNALELGIDIGGLDAVLLVGYPGTISSTLQQFGRSGRGQQESIAIFVASNSAIDQFIVRHPEYLLETTPEYAIINPENLLILMDHIRCAAFELPFKKRELFGSTDVEVLSEFLTLLAETHELHLSNDTYYWVGTTYPAESIHIRSLSNGPVELYLQENGKTSWLGEVDENSSFSMVHPQAIYFHQGMTYQVNTLDIEGRKAFLSTIDVDYYTMPKGVVEITILEVLQAQNLLNTTVIIADVEVFSQIKGYKCIDLETQIVRAEYPLHLPSSTIQTRGFLIQFKPELIDILLEDGIWNHTPNQYGPTWKRTRETILIRDHYACQVCGITDPQNHVHHLKPLRNFRSFFEANQPENLITLCDHCHRKAEQKVKVQSILNGTAHLLHALAPLIAMCDAKDLDYHYDTLDKTYAPYIILYEKIPGGIGLVDILIENYSQLLKMAFDTIQTCTCNDGCPACVGPANELGTGSRKAVIKLLQALL